MIYCGLKFQYQYNTKSVNITLIFANGLLLFYSFIIQPTSQILHKILGHGSFCPRKRSAHNNGVASVASLVSN